MNQKTPEHFSSGNYESLLNGWKWLCSTLTSHGTSFHPPIWSDFQGGHSSYSHTCWDQRIERLLYTSLMLQREELEWAQTSLYKKKISRHKSHFQRKPKPKIVATLNFISRAWGMLYPSMWLPREQDSFILCYSIISWKLLPYIIPMIFKSTLNGKFPQKVDFKLQFRNICQEML